MTPRRIRLTRAADLPSLQRAIARHSLSADVQRARATAVLLPSRAAGVQLRATLESLVLGSDATRRVLVLPDLVTRADWYAALHKRAGVASPMLSQLEREVLLNAAARDAIGQGFVPPFRMRAGIVAEMLAFFDALQRQRRPVDRFESLVLEDLAPRAEFDRGAERLLRQTRFLAAAFRNFEARMTAAGGLDEHGLRARLLEHDGAGPYRQVVVTVSDRACDPAGGLFPSDFDLLTRLPGLDAVEIVATERLLASGFGERLRDMLPGLEEESWAEPSTPPRLLAPDGASSRLFSSARDREEELRAAARRLKVSARAGLADPGRTAIVFSRPLPYVYLAQAVLQSAGIEYEVSDALPLAAEPHAALLDQIFAAVTSRFARAALIALLRSPHLAPGSGLDAPAPRAIRALDEALREANYLGDPRRLESLGANWTGELGVAALAACRLCHALEPLAAVAPVSAHVETLIAFLDAFERPRAADEEGTSRALRSRAAVRASLEELGAAARRHDDPPVRLDALAATIRRFLESQTFTPRRGTGGVQLVDARAARYGDFDVVHLAGLVDGEWPEPGGRNIFYPPFLLSQLGWPSDSARADAARAEFQDLLALARRETSVSTFVLENDAIVEPSPLLEDLEQAQLEVHRAPVPSTPVFSDEALVMAPPAGGAQPGTAREWLAVRVGRGPSASPAFRGYAGPARVAAHSVSAIDRYLDCPFKYFAASVLRLPEETPDSAAMSPKARGVFEHEVFRAFFAAWQEAGGQAIGAEHLDRARALFGSIAEEQLARLPEGEAALERTRLLGSPVCAGLGEIVLAAEAVRPVPVRERLLEHPIEGEFQLQGPEGARPVRLRGKADRVDLLADGTLRVIDYKSGRAPDEGRSIQLPIYAVCLEQQLKAARGQAWTVAEASYIAFGERDPVKVVVSGGPEGAEALAEGQARLLGAVARIERGEFPIQPANTRLCTTCGYAAVCRRDYVVE